MKRNILGATLLLLIVLFASSFSQFFIPKNICSIPSNEVSKIGIFNGSTGEYIEITDKITIDKLVNLFNTAEIKKENLSIEMGYSYRIIIYTNLGSTNFILNSEDTVRITPYSWHVSGGSNGYNYINRLFTK